MEGVRAMKKISSYILITQAVLCFFFSYSLFFILPHQFSQAIAHYVEIAPIIRNFYCLTLLVTGFIGVEYIYRIHKNKENKFHQLISLFGIGTSIVFGLLIFPLVEALYQIRLGVILESISTYRYALLSFSIYLILLIMLGIYSGYDLLVEKVRKKHVTYLVLTFIFVILPTSILSYQKYYDYEEVNLTENLKVEFVGVDGKGSLKVISNNHQMNDIFPSFMSSLTYDVLDNGALSNGQQVAVTIQYDHDLAKELHLDIIDEVETFEVNGLRAFYSRFEDIPTKIIEEARSSSLDYVHQKLLEVLPGKETQVSLVNEYYIREQTQAMDSVHALVELYRISYVHQGENYYYYRACHINHIHSDALKDLEILEPVISAETYRSSLCEEGKSDMSITEAKAHLYASLMNHYDYVEEIEMLEY